ncbi:hypothetical protein CIRMBP1292_01882 [Enterococcus cecorum]|nr:hypothetical protein CIRMBP1292_01882 [Enterococcus cecorum]
MEISKNIYGFIYITTNLINGKKYLGQKKIDKQGKWKNYLGSGKAFKNALIKYGKENFKREIIDVANTPNELNDLENYYTHKFNCLDDDNFYNLVHGGGTVTGLKFSKESIEKLRNANSGEKNFFYGKSFKGTENPFYGCKHSKESRLKMSKSHLGKAPWNKGKTGIYSKEAIEKMSEAKKGIPLSEEHKKHILESQKGENHPRYGKKHTERTKQLIREKAVGRTATEETKRKMSESQKRRFKANPKDASYSYKKVICINTGVVYKSVKEAADSCGLKNPCSISAVCNGKRKTAGKSPNGEKLIWKFVN